MKTRETKTRTTDRGALKSYGEERGASGAGAVSDQRRGLPQPPLEKPRAPGEALLGLPPPDEAELATPDVRECVARRVSRRRFTDAPLSLAHLSWLLWATQGVRSVSDDGYCALRTVPSAGARHPFETYLAVNRVEGLAPGRYRYAPLRHALVALPAVDDLPDKVAEAACGQRFCGTAPALFAWSAVPYRTEWRYPEIAMKVVLLDAGHVCQNLYLACEAAGLGTCAVAAYRQELADRLFGLDGQDEFVVYMAPVGHPTEA